MLLSTSSGQMSVLASFFLQKESYYLLEVGSKSTSNAPVPESLQAYVQSSSSPERPGLIVRVEFSALHQSTDYGTGAAG